MCVPQLRLKVEDNGELIGFSINDASEMPQSTAGYNLLQSAYRGISAALTITQATKELGFTCHLKVHINIRSVVFTNFASSSAIVDSFLTIFLF